ncbi:hypothetical protein CVT25_013890 [Psilocybe cyanescens]|uniref:BTB domain-containing protein n=1 Tax=Psilocybe cyanescens TaxID=93625 RepID=A0A409XZ21_PSICY|nr:hypothetical protein CVT25_013890 [Psilocybe cyanescens]
MTRPTPGNALKQLQHPLFENDPEADVTFCSTDGDMFHLQRKYLEANTGAFPGSEFDTRGEITHLTETSVVLHLLFQFVYPRREPSIEDIDFETLYALAEAAEKYEAFHAMTMCKIQMRSHVSKHPLEVLSHAARHDYPGLIQDAVPHLLRKPMVDVIEQLPTKFIVPWVRFRESWDSSFEQAIKGVLELRVVPPNTVTKHAIYFSRSLEPEICSICMVSVLTTLYKLKEMETVEDLKEALTKKRAKQAGCLSSACQYVNIVASTCANLKTKLDELPAFSTFVPTAAAPHNITNVSQKNNT